jgi:ubiquinone/menaquinone biosynthesis C-methylase UbiE
MAEELLLIIALPDRKGKAMDSAGQSQELESQAGLYLLGHSEDEELRLVRQAAELRQDSARLFDRIGLGTGSQAIDLGCGPQGVLELLSERVGSTGHVIGIERNPESVGLAKRFVAHHGLKNVDVLQGDATATVLPGASFDLVHARLVLVNVPRVEEIVCEMLRLARPGGVVASHEADYAAQLCDPPSRAWDRLFEIFKRYCYTNGIDPFVGRRVHRLFRDAGLIDIQVNPVIHLYPHGHSRRAIFWQFLQNVRDGIVDQKLMAESEFSDLTAELKEHLDHADTLVVSQLFFQVWGRKRVWQKPEPGERCSEVN